MKVIGYIRVSSTQQAEEGASLAAQQAKLQQYAELYGHELVSVVCDAGESAKSLKRPGIQQALAALEAGEAQGLLVCKLDRLTRSVKDLGTLLDRYFSTRFALFSVGDAIDTTSAAGRLVLNILTSVAQWEREATAERVKAVLEHKRANGVRLGAKPYDNPRGLRRLRELAKAGLTHRAIAKALNDEGILSQRGGPWFHGTVSRVLARLA